MLKCLLFFESFKLKNGSTSEYINPYFIINKNNYQGQIPVQNTGIF